VGSAGRQQRQPRQQEPERITGTKQWPGTEKRVPQITELFTFQEMPLNALMVISPLLLLPSGDSFRPLYP